MSGTCVVSPAPSFMLLRTSLSVSLPWVLSLSNSATAALTAPSSAGAPVAPAAASRARFTTVATAFPTAAIACTVTHAQPLLRPAHVALPQWNECSDRRLGGHRASVKGLGNQSARPVVCWPACSQGLAGPPPVPQACHCLSQGIRRQMQLVSLEGRCREARIETPPSSHMDTRPPPIHPCFLPPGLNEVSACLTCGASCLPRW